MVGIPVLHVENGLESGVDPHGDFLLGDLTFPRDGPIQKGVKWFWRGEREGGDHLMEELCHMILRGDGGTLIHSDSRVPIGM